ncbi:MAG: cellulase N-terminal Ig-like domain-containing protein, partial [Flavisolibacter sp.]
MMFRVKGFHLCVLLLSVFTACSQRGSDRFQLNQVGFVTSSPKLAVITGKTEGGKFYITANGSTYFTGTLSDEKQSKNSSTVTRIADFSAFKKEGVYHISVPGVGSSYEFRIAEDVFSDVSKAALKAYYYMRSDMPLEKTYAGKWARAAGHPDTTVLVHASAASDARPAGT